MNGSDCILSPRLCYLHTMAYPHFIDNQSSSSNNSSLHSITVVFIHITVVIIPYWSSLSNNSCLHSMTVVFIHLHSMYIFIFFWCIIGIVFYQTMPIVHAMPFMRARQCQICRQCQLCTQCHFWQPRNANYAHNANCAAHLALVFGFGAQLALGRFKILEDTLRLYE